MQRVKTPEEKAFCSCSADLQRGLTSPETIATDLYSIDVLTFEQRDQVQNDMVTADARTRKLLKFLGAQIQGNEAVFHKFIDVLKGEPAYSALVKKLETAYRSKYMYMYCATRLCKIHLYMRGNSKYMY